VKTNPQNINVHVCARGHSDFHAKDKNYTKALKNPCHVLGKRSKSHAEEYCFRIQMSHKIPVISQDMGDKKK